MQQSVYPIGPLWQGRIDAEEGAKAKRWHDVVNCPLANSTVQPLALIGFCCDAGVARNQGRVGAALGPAALRQALANNAWHGNRAVFDIGDVVCEADQLESAQAELGSAVAEQLTLARLPVVLGGGHEVAFGSWQGLRQHALAMHETPRIGILNLDAHFDLRAGAKGSSGTPFRQIADDCKVLGWPFQYGCLGIAPLSNTAALFERARNLGVWWRDDRQMEPARLPEILTQLADFFARCDLLYLSICLDVLPASVAPGVSAPAAGGVALSVIESIIDAAIACGKLTLCDIAELNPRFDIDSRTAKVAARLVAKFALS
jgi:formiminoglutamase